MKFSVPSCEHLREASKTVIESCYKMHGLSNMPTVATSSNMLVPMQLVLSSSTSPQTPIDHQYCTFLVPGGQGLGPPDAVAVAAAAAAASMPTACDVLQQQHPILQQQQTVIQQQHLQMTQPFYASTMLAGQQQLLDVVPVSCALPASCSMSMPAMLHPSQPAEQRSIFFAGVTPVIPAETLLALFSQFGPVQSINLFKPWAGSKSSKGCGIVVFTERHSAAAALAALHGSFQWPGARSPMIVEWMDSNKQHKKARAQPLSYPVLQQQPQQYVTMQPRPSMDLMMPGQLCFNGAGQQQLLM